MRILCWGHVKEQLGHPYNESNDPAYFNTQLKILTGPGLLVRDGQES